ncbi:hypothetical protein E2562_022206 [Oryza meyeriana var. granulata]|uniref:Cyclin N-terminal domain-containing protein n=1 Tax=Oryza meyeriana var. granulata TaxID=110450 RepID=A0A6G1DLR1_9ORYZ|nr:hypothetical protein E2562_022206 [Oryza meyeriana var. granulata]
METDDEDRAVAAAASAWSGPYRRRRLLLEFLLHASQEDGVLLCTGGRAVSSWLLEPLRDSNLELFALVAVWIASKIDELKPLSVKSLKALGDRIIADQHFTCRDFANAVTAYVISVPKQRWEFPILPWVTFMTSYDEEEIMKVSLNILMHVLEPNEMKEKDKRDFNI